MLSQVFLLHISYCIPLIGHLISLISISSWLDTLDTVSTLPLQSHPALHLPLPSLGSKSEWKSPEQSGKVLDD